MSQRFIPNTQTLGQLHGRTIGVDTAPLIPGVQGADATVNIPRGSIADFDARWSLIEEHTRTGLLDLAENDSDQVDDILNRSVRDRIDENRLSERWPAILDSLVDVDPRWR